MRADSGYPLFDHIVAAAILVLIPGLLLGMPLWSARTFYLLSLGIFALAYLLCVALLSMARPGEPNAHLPRVLLTGLGVFGAAFTAFLVIGWRLPHRIPTDFPTRILFGSAALGMTGLVALCGTQGGSRPKRVVLILILLVGVAGHAAYGLAWLPRLQPPSTEVRFLDSSLYVLKTTTYRHALPEVHIDGGGIVPFANGYLLGAGDGQFFLLQESDDRRSLHARKLAYQVPFNPDEFQASMHRIFGADERDQATPGGWFRVADIYLQERDGAFRLFASHHFWKEDTGCFVLRVSMLEGPTSDLLAESARLKWQTVYETNPCLPLNTRGPRGVRFAGQYSGGRMASLGEDELLLTVGDHEFDGWNRKPALSQDPATSYGKIILIHLKTRQAEVYSLGHHNPQGLYVAPSGIVWSTEHGPEGGDELNRIRRGANYGWPLVTYGTEYGLHFWPLSPTPGRHDGFEKPVFAFVPDIGISSLTGITSERFHWWRGDLLVSSLRARSLFRVRIEDGRAILTEPIEIGQRIRDLVESPDGRIVLWTDDRDVIFVEPAPTGNAESRIFQCTGCHSLKAWEHSSIGPNLWGVVGRRVGTAPDFRYSPAMASFGGRWTKERLDAFLANPRSAMPGTAMEFDGIPDPSEREQLIDYLVRLAE